MKNCGLLIRGEPSAVGRLIQNVVSNSVKEKDRKVELEILIFEKYAKKWVRISFGKSLHEGGLNAVVNIVHTDASVRSCFITCFIKEEHLSENFLPLEQIVLKLACEMIKSKTFFFTPEKEVFIDMPKENHNQYFLMQDVIDNRGIRTKTCN
jgi:hypothetical protein